MRGLGNKVVIVTGDATKIGAAVAKVLANYGVKVTLCDIDQKNGVKVAQNEEHIDFIHVDISDDQKLKQAIDQVVPAI